MLTRLRILFFLTLCLMTASSLTGSAESLKVTSKERVEYQNQISHFLQETYYATLCLAMTEEDIHTEIVQDLMVEGAVRFQPEFYLNSKRQRYMSPAQYLQELGRAFRSLDGESVSFSVSDISFGKNFERYGLSGCYAQADYDLVISYKEQTLVKRRCRMICLFPKASYNRRVLALQVEPVKDHYLAGPSSDSALPTNSSGDREEKTVVIPEDLATVAMGGKKAVSSPSQNMDDAKGIGAAIDWVAGCMPAWVLTWIWSLSWLDKLVLAFAFLFTYFAMDGRIAKWIAGRFGWEENLIDEFMISTVEDYYIDSQALRQIAIVFTSLLSTLSLAFFTPFESSMKGESEFMRILLILMFPVLYYLAFFLSSVIVFMTLSYWEESGFWKGLFSIVWRCLRIALFFVIVLFPLTWLYWLVVKLAKTCGWESIVDFDYEVERKLESLIDW